MRGMVVYMDRVLVIPVDAARPIRTVALDISAHRALGNLLQEEEGNDQDAWIEAVYTAQLAAFYEGTTGQPYDPPLEGMCMIVDEDGRGKRLRHNSRASLLYDGDIFGPALLVGMGVVNEEPDLTGLHESITAERVHEYTR